jgi:hypothetical protein
MIVHDCIIGICIEYLYLSNSLGLHQHILAYHQGLNKSPTPRTSLLVRRLKHQQCVGQCGCAKKGLLLVATNRESHLISLPRNIINIGIQLEFISKVSHAPNFTF